jgi:hypothetical protein
MQRGTFKPGWTEQERPSVVEPSGKGSGIKIVTHLMGSYFNGTSKVEYPPQGVRFAIVGVVTT